MLVRFFLLFLLLMTTGCGPVTRETASTAASYTVTDCKGTVVKMPAPPKKILTLSMGTDTIMLGLVKPERMAAINYLLEDPVSSNIVELAKQVPIKINNPSVEEIMAMQPDLVIVPDWGNIAQVENLRDLGLKVVVCPGPKNLAEIKDTVRLLGQAIGEPERGERLVALMDKTLADIRQKLDAMPQREIPRVVLISIMSGYGGSGCTFDEACRLAGVINGRAEAGIQNGQPMSKEQLLAIDPDILFLPSYTGHGSFDVVRYRRQYTDDPSLKNMKAVRNERMLYPRESYIYNGSQDFVFVVREIAYVIYGDEFAQSDREHLSVAD